MKVDLIDKLGSDLTVVNAARVSFDSKVSELTRKDKKLITYLAAHNHWTPFGHVQLQFRIKAPVFVARQLVKHQVGLVWNEVSRRYVDTEPEFYKPFFWRAKSTDKKQGSLNEAVDNDDAMFVLWERTMRVVREAYALMLNSGVAPEQARMILPQNMMTEWIWTGSLAAFARVVKLRDQDDAQKECRKVAQLINKEIIKEKAFKFSWEALT